MASSLDWQPRPLLQRSIIANRPRASSIALHGWDGENQLWYGPIEIQHRTRSAERLLAKLGRTSKSFFGKITVSGLPGLAFCTIIQDIGDAGLALIGMEEYGTGPPQVVVVIPEHRVPTLRPEFAFECAAFLRFIGTIPAGAELAVHDYMEAAVKELAVPHSVSFSIGTSTPLVEEIAIALATHSADISIAMSDWLSANDRAVLISPLSSESHPGHVEACEQEAVGLL